MTGKEIERYRLERNYSQREVSEIVGTTPKTIGNWKKGIGSPNPIQVEKLEKFFKLDEVVTEKEVLILDLINELVDAGIIKNKNSIPLETLELLVATIKIMTKKEK